MYRNTISIPVSTILYRYILIELAKWFALSFAFFFAAFFVNNILLLAKDILSRDVPLRYVLRLLLYTFPAILTYTIPFSILLAIIISMIQHTASYELLAMQTTGVSVSSCYVPVMVVALILSFGNFFVADFLLPRSAIEFIRLYQEIIFSSPGLELEPYSIRKYQDNIIISGDIDGSTIMQPVVIDVQSEATNKRIIASQRASLLLKESQGVFTLNMEEVTGHSNDVADKEDFDYFSSQLLEYNVLLYDLNAGIRSPTPREKSLRDINQYIEQTKPEVLLGEQQTAETLALAQVELFNYYNNLLHDVTPLDDASEVFQSLSSLQVQIANFQDALYFDQEYRIYETEKFRKISLPASSIFFAFFAFPIGVRLKRFNWSVGFGIGLLISVVYWCLLIGGQGIVIQNRLLPPGLIMWIPNLSLSLGGIIALVSLSRT